MKKLLVTVCAGLLVTGCGRQGKEVVVEAPEAQPSAMEQLHQAVTESLDAGNTNAAIDLLASALDDERYAAERAFVMRNLMDMLLRAERVEEAQTRLLAAAEAGDATALEGGFGLIYQHFTERGDATNVLAWTGTLLAARLPEAQERVVYGWRMRALYDAGQVDDAAGLIPECVARFDEATAVGTLRGFMGYLMQRGDLTALETALQALGTPVDEKLALASFASAMRIGLLAAQEKPAEADALFREQASRMLEEDMFRAYQSLQGKAKTPEDADRQEALDVYAVAQLADKPRVWRAAATHWVASAAEGKQYDAIPTRLNALLATGVDVNHVVRLFSAQFYSVLNTQNRDLIDAMLKVGDTLYEQADGESVKQSVRALQLDGSFINEDYAAAATYIEAGIQGRDEAWHEMALNKVKAHQDLKEGRIEEAIARFRKFMEHASGWEKGEVDPASGLTYTREMTLGQNALRIGNLYKQINKPTEANQAYEEAADYFTRALAECKPDSAEYALIKAEMAKLPGSSK